MIGGNRMLLATKVLGNRRKYALPQHNQTGHGEPE